MNYKDFEISLRSKVAPIYLFLGKEEFLIERAVKRLKDVVIKPGFEGFDFDLLYGEEIGFSEIFQKLTLFPMGSKKRLVVIKDADKIKIKEWKELLECISSPSNTAVLVLIMEKIRKEKGREKELFFSEIEKRAKVVDFSVKRWEIVGELKRWLREMGLEADDEALYRLQELVGDSLSSLWNELSKLSLFMNDRRRVTKEIVDRIVGYSRIFTRYELSRALGERDKKRALSILFQLYNWNERPEVIVGTIAREFYQLFLAQAMGRDSERLGKFLGRESGDWVIKKIIERSGRWHRAELITLLRELSRLDIQYKQGLSPFSSIESFILERV